MGVFQNNLMGAAAASASAGGSAFYDYQIANSVFLNGTSQSLTKTWGATPSDADKKAVSVWIKRSGSDGTNSEIGSTTNTKIFSGASGTGAVGDMLEINTNNPSGYSDAIHYTHLGAGGSGISGIQRFRDPSAWLHIIYIYNSDAAAAADRISIYYNGVRTPTTADTSYWYINGNANPDAGMDCTLGKNGYKMYIGSYVYDGAGWWGGQMADFIMIDGAASYTDFGEFKNGVWIPKDPSGLTFGNNGFHLDFASSGDLGNDVSGNNNDFTNVGSIPASAQLLDSPTFNSNSNGGNFCTLNPIYRGSDATASTYGTISIGNLKHHGTGGNGGIQLCTFLVPPSGKWYWEYAIIAGGANAGFDPGMGISDPNVYFRPDSSIDSTGLLVYDNATNKTKYNSTFVTTYDGSRGANGDVMGIAVDMDNGAFYVSKNGTWYSSGDPESGASRTNAGVTWTPASAFTSGMIPTSTPTGGTVPIININFGQDGTFQGTETAGGNSDTNGYGNFFSSVPAGYSAICTGALSMADAVDPAQTDDDYPQKLFSPILYTGSGSGDGVPKTNTITGLGFKPDFVNIKERTQADPKGGPLYDSTRGNTKLITTVTADAEVDQAALPGLVSFDTDGFKAQYPNTSDYYINRSNNTYVAWCQRANGGTTSSDASGDITSVGQVDPSGCFSIFTYTGSGTAGNTVAHHLDQAPDLMIFKERGNGNNWITLAGTPYMDTRYIYLDTTAVANTGFYGGGRTFSSSAGASTFTLEGATEMNRSSGTYVGYGFSNCEGYIKIGEYEGNGNADGSFVCTGFRPAWIMTKALDSTSNWQIFDNKRIGYNVDNNELYANISDAEATTDMIDILSNGFKMRIATDPNVAETYLYIAFAENPFKYATAR